VEGVARNGKRRKTYSEQKEKRDRASERVSKRTKDGSQKRGKT
jgi:hypothetical protein